MELFNEFLSGRFQTLIDLLLLGGRQTQFTKRELEDIFVRNHIKRNAYDEIKYWMKLHILLPGEAKGSYRLVDEVRLSNAGFVPFSRIEKAYLDSRLGTPEAAAFLSPVPSILAERERISYPFIHESGGGKKELPPDPELFQTVLGAIVERRTLRYIYRTKQTAVPREDEQIPFRVEYQVFDRRWWLILYLQEQDRTVKVPLQHILSAQLGSPHQVTDETIQAVIRRRYLSPEPVKLLIQNQNNALERAFLTLGQTTNLTAHCRDDGMVQMTFDWYTYDLEEIVKKLMYLGEYVKIIEPAVIRNRLADRLREALAMQLNVGTAE